MLKTFQCLTLPLCLCVFPISAFAQPANDNCANAFEIFIGENQPFETTDALTDGPEHPSALCFAFGDDFINDDVWFFFTAPNTATIEWSTCNMVSWDTRMAVYNAGTTCPLEDSDLLACNDDGASCTSFTSITTFPVEAGETYLLRLGGYLAGVNGLGAFDLNEIIPVDPPANDICLDSATVALTANTAQADLLEGVNEGTTIAATQDAGVPFCINNGEFNDVWYTFNNEGISDFELRFSILGGTTDGFIFEIFDDCATPALDTANGGTLNTTCLNIAAGTGALIDTITGFSSTPTDYLIRVSTRITFDTPGDFGFQLVSDEIVSNKDQFLLENVSFFPNPVTDKGNVKLNLAEAGQTTFEVYNSIGQLLNLEQKGYLSRGEHQFELLTSDLATGIYFLKVTSGEKQRVLKFVKH